MAQLIYPGIVKPYMEVELVAGGTVCVLPLFKREIAEIKRGVSDVRRAYELCAAIMSRNTDGQIYRASEIKSVWAPEDIGQFFDGCKNFAAAIEAMPELALPTYPGGNDGPYDIISYWEKTVADYCNISIFEVEDMDLYDYYMIRRDAFISLASRTAAGREYLENAKRLTLTEPDRASLRETFGKR